MAGPARVVVVRSGLQESVHEVDVAVVDAAGSLVASAGDPGRVAYARSCMKPLQASVSMWLAALDYTDREAAVMCASHNGEPVHIDAVRGILARGDVPESALRCPAAYPDLASLHGAPQRLPINFDCSGKHAGMLAACRARDWPLESYRDPGHPLQQQILSAVLAATGLGGRAVQVGVDGCGVPVHGFPLAAMARIYATLLDPAPLGDEVAPWADRALAAMRAQPYLVAGRGRVDTAVTDRTNGGVVAMLGAEGMTSAAARDRRLGIALKVRDGAGRATAPVLVAVLRRLDVLDDDDVDALVSYARPRVLGGGEPVGELETHLDLDAGS
jgi:L-asparaginase II